MNTQSDILGRIKSARLAHGMTIATMSEMISVPYTTLQKYLAGNNDMPAGVLMGVADALGVSTDWILYGHTSFDPEGLAQALRTVLELREISGEKLDLEDYSQIFNKSYSDWEKDRNHEIHKTKLESMGVKLIRVATEGTDPQ